MLLILVSIGSAFILILSISSPNNANALGLGDAATQDILAPRGISYESEVLTEEKRQEAADAVEPQYAPTDKNIKRAQAAKLNNVLNYIGVVRADVYATAEQKLSDLAAIQSVNLSAESLQVLLSLNDAGWVAVKDEATRVLDEVMSETIQEGELDTARQKIPTEISVSLPDEQNKLVSELVLAFVTPNSLYSEDLTETAREEARAAVTPVQQTYIAGQTVIQRGHVITESDLEALDQFGLLERQTDWKDYASVGALTVVNMAFIGMYFSQRPDLRSKPASLVLMAVLFLVFLLSARLLNPNRTVVPYMFPLAGFGMLIAALINSRTAFILSLPLAILTGYGLNNSYELTLFYIFTSVIGILMLRNVHRLLTFFWAGLGVAISGIITVLAVQLTSPLVDTLGLLQLGGASLFHGMVAAAITIILQFLLAQLLGLTTTLQLVELSRPDQPLLQTLLRNAPGTYQHSLQIANLAEQAAERIGADTMLTRVGALYHDIGKVRYPLYFIENQMAGMPNPHDNLPPAESAAIIIQHVIDGEDLAKKHRLPKRIIDFILEHHGTMMTKYQYYNAVKEADGDTSQVDESLYSYPGPRPQSRETALVMLADGVEARSRAERPESEEAIRQIVKDTIDQRLASGQLAETDLTLQNIEEIITSFTNTLRGVFHLRIEYPNTQATTLRSKDAASPQEETP